MDMAFIHGSENVLKQAVPPEVQWNLFKRTPLGLPTAVLN
jgi:hypothetical protein